jgi:AraC-like DNA-binding protein
MPSPSVPLLEKLRIFHSRNAEETRAFLRAKQYMFDVSRRQAGQLDARLNGTYMPGVYIGYVQYGGAAVTLAPGPARADTWLHLPLHGHLEASLGGGRTRAESVIADPGRAAVVSSTHERCALVSEAGSTRIQLALNNAALNAQLAALLGEPVTKPLDFAPAIDLTSGYGRSLMRYILAAVADLEDAGSALASRSAMTAFEQFLLSAFLMSHPHTYSDALQRRESTILPRDVRRAVDYIEANLEQAVTVADLVNVTGVAGRTLFMHFKEFRGVSPMRYLRNARLRQVRDALLCAEPGASITEIAMKSGFTHLGRFSVAYRHHFGETPSETLRCRRQAWQLQRPWLRTPPGGRSHS